MDNVIVKKLNTKRVEAMQGKDKWDVFQIFPSPIENSSESESDAEYHFNGNSVLRACAVFKFFELVFLIYNFRFIILLILNF